MKKAYLLLCIILGHFSSTQAQINLQQGKWRAALQRTDGNQIPFQLDIKTENRKSSIYILNSTERIKTEQIVFSKDSAIIRMPVFESYFKVKIINKDSLNGIWVSGSGADQSIIPFSASFGGTRFPEVKMEQLVQVHGKWEIEFTRVNQTKRPAIGQFTQSGNVISGSVLTPTGDYRYLDGLVSEDSLFVSTFDGSHALLLKAKINNRQLSGMFLSGAKGRETWTAVKNDQAVLKPAETPITAVKEGSDGKPDFTFKDLLGNPVSLRSDRFKNKVVILQLMGSWCPNCMDETAFLSDYYLKNKDRGIEIIALGYEISTDETRSVKSLQKFQKQFNVQYPILNTGVTASDPQRTEKTFPQLTSLRVFPTTVILDKNGVISKISTTYYGPGAGDYHLQYKAEFEKTVNDILKKTQ